ncbi:hypothetical protein P7D66_08500 [Enterococcus avium]|uniref:hypothetical protein n=1 Tax=Enterococcus avium TaxID=33945 RepID=UPI00288F4BDE|nr:hypothetical protein [Enterococcus avium]MDT2422417.1 hypothetical protein [Enterococcus avium]
MENQENRSNFRPMTLTSLLLLFHNTHLNLLDYERKPPDKLDNNEERQSAPERTGDPA